MQDQRNLLLAIVLSVGILVLFQAFFAPPPPDPMDPAAIEAGVDGADGVPPTEGVPSGDGSIGAPIGEAPGIPGTAASVPVDAGMATTNREAALAADADRRLRIDTARLQGSLQLTGARLDDLTLIDYRETVDPESPFIDLLSPRSAPNPYYVDFGWSAGPGVVTPPRDAAWQVVDGPDSLSPEGGPVTLAWDNGEGLTFRLQIAVDENYLFTVTQAVDNATDGAVALRPYARILRVGTPDTLGFFILHEGPYGVFDGTLEEYSYEDIQDDGEVRQTSTGGWLGFTDKYWLVALVPDQAEPFDGQFTHRLTETGIDRYIAAFAAPEKIVLAGGSAETTQRIFAGAKEVDVVDAYEAEFAIDNFDLTIDFGWFYFLTKPFFYALDFLNDWVGNFGVAILIFTVIIKLIFFPLANKSYRAMSKMKGLQPQMLEIRDRFKEDRQRMNMEMMELYKREKVNPASGCLPILIQIPVFFALYKVLFVTIEMRHTPFFGWIRDLSAPDPTSMFNLFGLIPWDPPSFLMIGIWPLIMGVSMFAQQKLNPAPTDPIQQKIFMALPIVFTFLLAGFPAGLVIYWAWNNILSILQQWVIMKRMGVKIGGGIEAPAGHAPPSVLRKPSDQPGKGGDGGADEDGDDDAADARPSRPTPPGSEAGGSNRSRRAAAAAAQGDKATTDGGSRRGGKGGSGQRRRPARRR